MRIDSTQKSSPHLDLGSPIAGTSTTAESTDRQTCATDAWSPGRSTSAQGPFHRLAQADLEAPVSTNFNRVGPQLRDRPPSYERSLLPPVQGEADDKKKQVALSCHEAAPLPAQEPCEPSTSQSGLRGFWASMLTRRRENKRLFQLGRDAQRALLSGPDQLATQCFAQLFEAYRRAGRDLYGEFFQPLSRYGTRAVNAAAARVDRPQTLLLLLQTLTDTLIQGTPTYYDFHRDTKEGLIGYRDAKRNVGTLLQNLGDSVRSSLWRKNDVEALSEARKLIDLTNASIGLTGSVSPLPSAASNLFPNEALGSAAKAALELAEARECPQTLAILVSDKRSRDAYREELMRLHVLSLRDGDAQEAERLFALFERSPN